MNPLFFVIAFFWLSLIENNTGFPGVIADLGAGLEIRGALLLKIGLFLSNIYYYITCRKVIEIPRYFIIFSAFLLLSTCYTILIAPQHFIQALSVNLHIQLMLNISLFILFYTRNKRDIHGFYRGLRYFGFFNGLFVIVSFFFPSLSSAFESFALVGKSVNRAFGLMGDEVSAFLTFFLYDSLIFKRIKQFAFYLFSIFCTAGIGAFFIVSALLIYYFIFVKRITTQYLFLMAASTVLLIVTGIFFSRQLGSIGVFKRISTTIDAPKKENGALRIISMTTAIDMIGQRPLMGYGYGNYGAMVYDKYAPMLKKAGHTYEIPSIMIIIGSTFNPYLQILAEAGILGLIIYCWFLRKLYIKSKEEVNIENNEFRLHQKSISGWMLIFFLTCLSANWFLPSSFNLLLVVSLFGISLAIKNI